MATPDIENIDAVIHGRLRLGVMAYLAQAEAATFTELKDALKVTQGNLSKQLRTLEDAGYVDVDKRIVGRKPLTTVRMTRTGRKALKDYLAALTKLVGPVRE